MSLRSDSPVLSSDALAAQLTQSLPVHISSDAVQEQPKLAILLEDLAHRLSPSAALSSTQKALSCSSTILRHARRVYLEHEALLHYALSAARSPAAPTSLRQLEDAVALSQLAASLQLVPTEPASGEVSTASLQCTENDKLLATGATVVSKNISSSASISATSDGSSCSNSWHSANASSKSFSYDKRDTHDKQSSTSSLQVALKNKPNNMRDPLMPQLSSSRALRARASRLARSGGRLLHQHTSDRLTETWRTILPALTPLLPDDTKGAVASGARVSSHLASLRRAVTSSNKTLTAHSALVHALLLQVDGQLVEYGTSLVGLVQRRRLSHHPLRHLQYLATTLYAQHHKLRCVELQMKCSTYSAEAVASLKALSRRLASLTEETTHQLASLQYRLEPYSRLDPSYLSLLDEYSKLRSDIEFCQADHS